MNVLFVGIREKDESNITSAPIKIANCLFNRLSKDKKNLFFYNLANNKVILNDEPIKITKNNEFSGSIFKIGKVIKSNKIDVVYLARYYTVLAIYLSIIKHIYNFKLVYTVHGFIKKEKEINNIFKFYSVIAEYFLFKNCNKIVAVTGKLKKEIMTHYPKLDSKKIIIINNGVELEKVKAYIDIRKTYNLDVDKKIIFTIGTRKIKNIEKILEYHVNSPKIYDKTYLLIAGGIDTEYAEKLYSDYHKYENIKFIGNVDTNLINNIYDQIDLFVQISLFETFGVSIVEALLHKKNVIISRKLPIAEYFNLEETCFYDDECDNLEDLMYSCLYDKDKVNYKGYNKVLSLFNWDKVCYSYYTVFKDTVSN